MDPEFYLLVNEATGTSEKIESSVVLSEVYRDLWNTKEFPYFLIVCDRNSLKLRHKRNVVSIRYDALNRVLARIKRLHTEAFKNKKKNGK